MTCKARGIRLLAAACALPPGLSKRSGQTGMERGAAISCKWEQCKLITFLLARFTTPQACNALV